MKRPKLYLRDLFWLVLRRNVVPFGVSAVAAIITLTWWVSSILVGAERERVPVIDDLLMLPAIAIVRTTLAWPSREEMLVLGATTAVLLNGGLAYIGARLAMRVTKCAK